MYNLVCKIATENTFLSAAIKLLGPIVEMVGAVKSSASLQRQIVLSGKTKPSEVHDREAKRCKSCVKDSFKLECNCSV